MVKIILAIIVSSAVIPVLIFEILYLFNITSHDMILVYPVFRIIQTVAICIIVYLIQYVIHNFRLQEQLREAEKMRIVSQLAASVSHEVRNPLTTVKGILQLIREMDLSKEKKEELTKLSLQELDNAIRIISDYLTFAKPQLENIEQISVLEECRHIINVLSPYANMHQAQLELSGDANCEILGDKLKFHQCLVNLVKNCIEASHAGKVSITSFRENNKVMIHINDTGVGMTQDEIRRLGTPYYSTKEKGTGLGTMVSYSIIKAMGGTIRVESSKGEGTSIVITLPLALGSALRD